MCMRPSGPTLSNVYGRGKNLLKHRDGTISPFYLGASLIAKLPEFKEYRIRQTDVGTLVVEVGGRRDLNPNELNSIIDLVKKQAGNEFQVEVRVIPEIDWRGSVKTAWVLQRSVVTPQAVCRGLH